MFMVQSTPCPHKIYQMKHVQNTVDADMNKFEMAGVEVSRFNE